MVDLVRCDCGLSQGHDPPSTILSTYLNHGSVSWLRCNSFSYICANISGISSEHSIHSSQSQLFVFGASHSHSTLLISVICICNNTLFTLLPRYLSYNPRLLHDELMNLINLPNIMKNVLQWTGARIQKN